MTVTYNISFAHSVGSSFVGITGSKWHCGQETKNEGLSDGDGTHFDFKK